MTHSRDGTSKRLTLIRGKTRDDPGVRRHLKQNIVIMFISNLLTGRKWLEWGKFVNVQWFNGQWSMSNDQ